jgi:signal transduction histidine kinase
MPSRVRQHSLLAHSILWVVFPFSLLIIGLSAAGIAIYQHSVTELIMDRDRQVASLAADSVSEGLEGYQRVLTALASNEDIHSSSNIVRQRAIETAGNALSIFNAGVLVVDAGGSVLTSVPPSATNTLPAISEQDYFQYVRSQRAPFFSHVITSPLTGEPMIVVTVPILGTDDTFSGALLGVVYLRTSALGDLVKNLIVGNNGVAYLVGQRGTVLYHHDPTVIGANYSGRPSVAQVKRGLGGGLLWQTSEGQRFVDGYAPIRTVGWGLIVQESWDMAIAPTQAHIILLTLTALVATIIGLVALWLGVRQITTPVQIISKQISRVADGRSVEPIQASRIAELDILGHAFNHMAAQIETYRAGLRRYVGAITESQEDERRRISRELHDETVQSLMVIGRRIELYEASEQDQGRLAQLEELHAMMDATVDSVRQISRDLRPLILDDLGIVPALRTLVRGVREGDDPVPSARLEITGTPVQINPEQELAVYRITQEALNNVRRHAHATRVEVQLTFDIDTVRLKVIDNGKGFNLPASLAELAEAGHFGLMGIQERVWAAGGTLTIDSTPNQGTCIHINIPNES